MSAKIRRKSTSIVAKLQKQTHLFPFFQAVRLLLRSAVQANKKKKASGRIIAADNPVAKHLPPHSEFIKFKQTHTLGFPHSEIEQLSAEELPDGKKQWQLQVNFLSLIGSTGVLPFHYTELIFQRLKQKDSSFKDFLELFNHRTVSLFYQAGIKYRLPLAYEHHHLTNKRSNRVDSHTHVLLSILGLGNGSVNFKNNLPLDVLIYYGGLLGQNTRSGWSLQQVLSDYFDVPISVNELVGEWHDLIDDVRMRLPSFEQPKGQNVCLGRSTVLGKRGWFAQGKIKIEVGPLNESQFARFAPGTDALNQLDALVKQFAGNTLASEYVVKAQRKDLPSRVQLSKDKPAQIGWNTWLASSQTQQLSQNNCMDIKVSSARFQSSHG